MLAKRRWVRYPRCIDVPPAAGDAPMLTASLLLCTTLSLAADDVATADERQLRDAGVGTDGPALLEFFRRRTLTDADRAAVAKLIIQLGDENSHQRDEASR